MALTQGWVEVTPSQFPFEAEGLSLVRDLLPDEPPFRAWSNFEFRDNQGKWHEVDLVVLGRRRMHLVELKYWAGAIRGDDHIWRREGKRSADSPLKLARRKAQRLASKLTDRLYELAQEAGAQLPDPRTIVPFVQEAVFLHHPTTKCLLPVGSRKDIFSFEGKSNQTLLPGISERLLEQADSDPKWSIGAHRSAIVAQLMEPVTGTQRRQREAGSWIIDEEPLDEGLGWQDWAAFQKVTQDKARIRFFVNPPGTSDVETKLRRLGATHEYQVVSTLTHDGLIPPRDIVDTEMGVGLVYPRDDRFQRLDLWLADQSDGIPLTTQLSIIRQVAEALGYAHGHRVVHRGLNPSAVFVRQRSNGAVQVKVGSWQSAGSLGTTTNTGVASPVTMLGAASADAIQQAGAAAASDLGVSPSAFQAPEGIWSPQADRIRLDIFALGAVAYYLVAGRPAALSTAALRERLGRDSGLDLAADLAQVPSALRSLVLDSTRPAVTSRTPDITSFLTGLAVAEAAAALPELGDEIDPLDATPGTVLGGRWRLVQRLGAGSTAVGLMVTDLQPENDRVDPRRVLKVAVDQPAATRLADEAAVLQLVKSPRVVRLIEGPLPLGGRTALLLQFAGTQTLADLLRMRSRLSLDLLERYGTDLLEAVVALDAAGVDHRDLKPANLGVFEGRGSRTKHLMLYDFSLTRAAAQAVDAGTRGYLDPFLGTAKRPRWDSAAERYSAAVVLFEMATGDLPIYGDGESDPVASGGELQLGTDQFDPAVADTLTSFFQRSLHRDADQRFDTAQEMLAQWRELFSPVPPTQPDNADELAEQATTSTPLERSGLSARALSAIEPLGVKTVADLIALDPVRLNRLPGAADLTRREVKSRAQAWRLRLIGRRRRKQNGEGALPAAVAAARLLAEAIPGEPHDARHRAVNQLLGLEPGVDAFVAPGALGPALGLSRPRGPQLIDEMQRAWADTQATKDLLDSLLESVTTGLTALGGVATVKELTEQLTAALPDPDAVVAPDRICAGLLRVTLDRASALRLAGAAEHPLIPQRRRDGQLSRIAVRSDLHAAADTLAPAADQLVRTAKDAGEWLVPAGRAAAQLRPAFEKRVDGDRGAEIGPDDARLVALAAGLSTYAALTGDGALHHRDIPAAVAVRTALDGLAPSERLGVQELRDRVRARFPQIARLPDRTSGLDEIVADSGLLLIYDESARVYRSPELRSDTTGLETRITRHPELLAGPTGNRGQRLVESAAARSFLAIGVPGRRYDTAVSRLAGLYDASIVDVTGQLIAAMKQQAADLGLPWDKVTAADAAQPDTRDAAGLAALVARALPQVHEAIESAASNGRPVLVTELAPLARYDQLGQLARWSDLTAHRAAAIWVLVPQLHGSTTGLVDGKPLPLGAPGQLINLDEDWLTTLTTTAPSEIATSGSTR